MKPVRGMLCALLLLVAAGSLAAQAAPSGQIDLDLARSREEFRWGVGAFHEARFADAIVAFTRALSFKPDNVLSREWLGRSYFHSGLVNAALAEWERIASLSGAYLSNRIDTIEFRRGVAALTPPPTDYAVSTVFAARTGDARLFRRPASVGTGSDGTIYVTSMATHEVLRINTNGLIVDRLQGGVTGLDLPFDVMLRDDETLVVSEFGADRVSILDRSGNRRLSMGETGLGEGQLLGPQFLAMDDSGSIYVSEWGGRRVSKFSADGDFLLAMGEPGIDFDGLQAPTGVEWYRGIVWIADRTSAGPVLRKFDESGNYLSSVILQLDRSVSVEDIELSRDGRFLLAAGNVVYLFDPENEAIEAAVAEGDLVRATSAAEDANRRVVICDFDGDSVSLYSPASALYSGLDVRVNRVISRQFPRISVEVSVSDRFGHPVVGLGEENFLVSEDGIPLDEVELLSAGHTVVTLESAVVVDTVVDEQTGGADASSAALRDIYRLMGPEDTLRLFTTSSDPQQLIELPASEERFIDALSADLLQSQGLPSQPEVAFRLAAAELSNRDIRRQVMYVTAGELADEAFTRYGLEEIADMYVNNGITFSVVLVAQATPDRRLLYLVEKTGGFVGYVYEARGLAPLVQKMRREPTGKYWLSYLSGEDTDFGRAYISLSLEARLEIRSGRDETGYFGPSE